MVVPQLKIELPYDQQLHFRVSIQKNRKQKTQTNICTPMFTAALFTIVKRWKPKCPNARMDKHNVIHAHIMDYRVLKKRVF